jgi:hypothetical protein
MFRLNLLQLHRVNVPVCSLDNVLEAAGRPVLEVSHAAAH